MTKYFSEVREAAQLLLLHLERKTGLPANDEILIDPARERRMCPHECLPGQGSATRRSEGRSTFA